MFNVAHELTMLHHICNTTGELLPVPNQSLFQDYNSVLVEGICQIPDPLYKLIGSIVSFYIPLVVMLLTYALTVRLLAVQEQSLGASGSSGWMAGQIPTGATYILDTVGQ